MTKTWTVDELEAARKWCDPWADGVVLDMLQQGDQHAWEMYSQVARMRSVIPDNLPESLTRFLLQHEPPAWVDMRQVALGQEVYRRHGLEINMILLCGSLPACYAAAKGVHVLSATHQITGHVGRRVIETLRFLMDVMEPGNLALGEVGPLTAKKVRLLHALNRHILRDHAAALANPERDDKTGDFTMRLGPQEHQTYSDADLQRPELRWNEDLHDAPLNQEDMAMTLMSFVVTVLDGLAKFKITVEPEEEESYLHAWRYVGWLMGVEEALIPENMADARSLMAAIGAHQYAPSPAGQYVTAKLIEFMENLVPGEQFDGIIPSKVRVLVGDHVGDMLAVPKADWTRALLGLVTFVHGVEHQLSDENRLFSWFTDHFGRTVMHEIEKMIRADGRAAFHVPEALREEWNLKPHPFTQGMVAAPVPGDPPAPEIPTEAAVRMRDTDPAESVPSETIKP